MSLAYVDLKLWRFSNFERSRDPQKLRFSRRTSKHW